MKKPDYTSLVAGQRGHFLAGRTRAIEWRIGQLNALKAMLEENRRAFYEALRHDLRRNDYDSDLMDVQYCINEADYALKHIHDWVEPKGIHTPLAFQPGQVKLRRDPLGVTLIIGAWNEPLMLVFAPLAPALAAGNTAVLKPSEIAPATAKRVAELVPKYLDNAAIAVVEGGVPETTALLEQKWDMIFFTGSPTVGRIIHQAAAKHLTPCVLELGGKSPAIVHSSANLKVAARRIAYGRYLNGGQICTAPDYVLVWPEVRDEFLAHLRDTVKQFYGDDPQQSPDFGRPPNRKTYDRLAGLLGSGTAFVGGQTDPDDLYIAPTVLIDVAPDSPIMQEEVFGPILPVLEIDSVEKVIEWVNSRPRPLGLYVFAEDHNVAERILEATGSGDACVNDCAVQPLVPELPFGGVGNSGMGKYHGHWGYEAFTNARGVLYHSARIDPGGKYPPYTEHTRERTVMDKLL